MVTDPNSGFDMSALKQFANSDSGKALIHILNNQNQSKVQEAIASASSGDLYKARSIIESILSAPGVKEALKHMEEENGK